MAYLASRQRVIHALSLQARHMRLPMALRTSFTPTQRHLSDKPGLESTDMRDAANARRTSPPQPKISSASVPGHKENLTEEQKREVEEHNRDFEKKHKKTEPAGDDKVDQKFWQSGDESTK